MSSHPRPAHGFVSRPLAPSACLLGGWLAFGCAQSGADSVQSIAHEDDRRDSGDRPTAGEDETYPLSAFCADLRAAWVARCQRDGRKNCQRHADDGKGDEVCRATRRALTAGRVRYDGERAAECVRDEAFDLVKAWQVGWIPPLVCDGILVGLAPLGGACYPEETLQKVCAEGYCDRAGSCPGVCTEYVATGGPCSPARCAPGDYCDGENRCRRELELSEPCPDGWGCALPAVCTDGVCRLQADLGEPCDREMPCAYPYLCAEGSCVLRVGRGDPCDTNERCPEALACAFVPPGGTTRECAPLPREGDPCDRRSGCAPGFVCVSDGSPYLGSCAPGDAAAPSVTQEPAPSAPAPCTGD